MDSLQHDHSQEVQVLTQIFRPLFPSSLIVSFLPRPVARPDAVHPVWPPKGPELAAQVAHHVVSILHSTFPGLGVSPDPMKLQVPRNQGARSLHAGAVPMPVFEFEVVTIGQFPNRQLMHIYGVEAVGYRLQHAILLLQDAADTGPLRHQLLQDFRERQGWQFVADCSCALYDMTAGLLPLCEPRVMHVYNAITLCRAAIKKWQGSGQCVFAIKELQSGLRLTDHEGWPLPDAAHHPELPQVVALCTRLCLTDDGRLQLIDGAPHCMVTHDRLERDLDKACELLVRATDGACASSAALPVGLDRPLVASAVGPGEGSMGEMAASSAPVRQAAGMHAPLAACAPGRLGLEGAGPALPWGGYEGLPGTPAAPTESSVPPVLPSMASDLTTLGAQRAAGDLVGARAAAVRPPALNIGTQPLGAGLPAQMPSQCAQDGGHKRSLQTETESGTEAGHNKRLNMGLGLPAVNPRDAWSRSPVESYSGARSPHRSWWLTADGCSPLRDGCSQSPSPPAARRRAARSPSPSPAAERSVSPARGDCPARARHAQSPSPSLSSPRSVQSMLALMQPPGPRVGPPGPRVGPPGPTAAPATGTPLGTPAAAPVPSSAPRTEAAPRPPRAPHPGPLSAPAAVQPPPPAPTPAPVVPAELDWRSVEHQYEYFGGMRRKWAGGPAALAAALDKAMPNHASALPGRFLGTLEQLPASTGRRCVSGGQAMA